MGKRCSNVGDLLRLLLDQVASPTLNRDLGEVLRHVGQIDGSPHGSSVIFNWRNPSLHGEITYATIGGTVYSIALLIALDEISPDYEKLRDMITNRISLGHVAAGSPWSYYPPY